MRIEEIRTSPQFEKQYKKLPKRIKELAKGRGVIFRANLFDSRLETHKLHGMEKDIWSFSINRSYRIKFIFLGGNKVLFLEIGTHNIYK